MDLLILSVDHFTTPVSARRLDLKEHRKAVCFGLGEVIGK